MRPEQENQASEEDNSVDPGGAVRNVEAAPEDEENLEPEKEKNPQPQVVQANLDYCSIEAIAERLRGGTSPGQSSQPPQVPRSEVRPAPNQWPPSPEPRARKTLHCC